MNKFKNLLIICFLSFGLLLVSGCTSGDYSVRFQDFTDLQTYDDAKAWDSIIPNDSDAQLGFTVTDYGTKVVDGVTVYYCVYTDVDDDNKVKGDIYFQKSGKWYSILWTDQSGNPNKNAINNDVENKIKNA